MDIYIYPPFIHRLFKDCILYLDVNTLSYDYEILNLSTSNDIQNAYSDFTPLNPEIKTAIRIVPEEETNCKRGGEYVTNEQMNDKKFLKLIKAMEE